MRLKDDPDAPKDHLFFQNARLNNVIIIKHSVAAEARRSEFAPAVGTKLFFPFNEHNAYAGGNTIFLHDKELEAALADKCGLDRRGDKAMFDQDVRLLRALDTLPTLDPFLLRDALQSERIEVNPAYLEISEEEWFKIEDFIRERFVPLIKSAFPEETSSHGKTMQLVEKLWECKDERALAPLIIALRLPEDKAMEIFYAWKVITFYSCLYNSLRPKLIAMATWLKDAEGTIALLQPAARGPLESMFNGVKSELRTQWLAVDKDLAEFETAYQKMFKHKETGEFLGFLRNCRDTFWRLGDAVGKLDHTLLCWDRITARHHRRHLNLEALHQALRVFDEILASRGDGKMRIAS